MFGRLRNKIIVITMIITTVVLVLSGALTMLLSSSWRPEPKPHWEPEHKMMEYDHYDERELKDYIENDRREGGERLVVVLTGVGLVVEIVVFMTVSFASQKMVEPVKKTYEKQKLFIANASHELKTPLAIIQANMEVLEVDAKNAKWKKNVENEVDHANKMVLGLLKLARMDAGETEKKKLEKVDLTEELKKRVEKFNVKYDGEIKLRRLEEAAANGRKKRVQRMGLGLGVRQGARDRLIRVVLPKQDLLQVIDILMDNATKYSDKEIGVAFNQNKIAISNDGAIVRAGDRVKVFDRFYQTDKTKDGSGLGLAIAKAICEQNGWQISCDGDEKITTFTVNFSGTHKMVK